MWGGGGGSMSPSGIGVSINKSSILCLSIVGRVNLVAKVLAKKLTSLNRGVRIKTLSQYPGEGQILFTDIFDSAMGLQDFFCSVVYFFS